VVEVVEVVVAVLVVVDVEVVTVVGVPLPPLEQPNNATAIKPTHKNTMTPKIFFISSSTINSEIV